jgi:hypothetical protein
MSFCKDYGMIFDGFVKSQNTTFYERFKFLVLNFKDLLKCLILIT